MDVSELYDRCVELTALEPSTASLRFMHETLVLTCGEALRDTRQGFGNVFSQVDYLCKRHGIAMRHRIAIQQMRVHSNGRILQNADDWLYDVRALVLFISAVFKVDIPHELLTRLPVETRTVAVTHQPKRQVLRCVVTSWDASYIYATTAEGAVCIDYVDSFDKETAGTLLTEGMQLNLLDCTIDGTTVTPSLIVIEPDFLVDISAIAACFQEYGHHPLSYLLNRLKPRANSQQILLGNFAGTALDDLINHPDISYGETLRTSFREQALQFCTCTPFNGQRFKEDSRQQVLNIQEAVDILFSDYNREHALLEPSFVCEQLGLQGRVDLMTDDMRLLVEQKSGKNWNIECGASQQHKEDHYVQLLLYYGVLSANFHLSPDQVDIRLLYSKYPARQGLLVVNYYQHLFHEAVRLRNRIVAQEINIARQGFDNIIPLLRADLLLENQQKRSFFDQYIRGDVEQIIQPFRQLSADERDYVERMLTFVYREQLAQKVGVQEGQGGAVADLWNMPLADKQEAGNILMGTIVHKETDAVTLAIDTQTVLPNFRRGDMVYLYHFEQEPDVRDSILFKGVIHKLTDTQVTIHLNDSQQNTSLFHDGTYAIEHGASDIGTTSALRSIHAFCTASADRRELLLGLRPPRRNASQKLSHSYHPHYDDVLLRAKQARDFFLLQGPPGTGKTSMALRFLVEEELRDNDTMLSHQNGKKGILLTAYTNRAVDEICSMLEDAGFSYIRLGNEASCDPRYASRLLENVLGQSPKLSQVRQQLIDMPIIVSTTSTLLARPHILELKHFSLCIVDEASQILEPNIIGLLVSDQIDRFILIGDHKQLPAVVQQPDDEPRLHSCRLSLFERLLEQERSAKRADFIGLLRRQGRMHPDIAAFPNEMFYAREHLEPVPCPHQTELHLDYQQPSEDALDDVLKQHRVIFFPTTQHPSPTTQHPSPITHHPTSDKANQEEARQVADLLRRIERQTASHFDPNHTVGVIVPYRNQIAMIRHEIAQLGIPRLMDITIDTVERYQGSQRDVIIYSFTISRPYQLDFLTANCFEESDSEHHTSHTIDRKLNVAMTRARKQLILLGDSTILSRNALFAELIRRYQIK